MRVLVVGATGSIGHLAVEEAIRQGHTVRALVRDTKKAGRPPDGTDVVVGDLTRLETLAAAVDGVDAIVFTHGSDGGGKAGCGDASTTEASETCSPRWTVSLSASP